MTTSLLADVIGLFAVEVNLLEAAPVIVVLSFGVVPQADGIAWGVAIGAAPFEKGRGRWYMSQDRQL